MFNVVSTILIALAFAVPIMYINKINATGLSLRGRRVLFVVALLIGAFFSQTIANLFYVCDTHKCQYVWGNSVMKSDTTTKGENK